MKTLLLSILAFAGLAAFVPGAEASHRYIRYYDRCGAPVYGYGYRDDCYAYSRPVYGYRPRAYYGSYAPRYYYDSCAPRYYSSRPRFSLHFGF